MPLRAPLACFILLGGLSCGGGYGSGDSGLPPAAGTFTATPFTTGLSAPTAMAFAPDGRLFICEQGGDLRVVKNGVLLAAPFHTFAVDSSGERGLLGVAFDPAFAANGFVYAYYTLPGASGSASHNRIVRLHTLGAGVDTSDGTVTPLLELDDLSSATNHNGGALHFGADGKLYAGVGENANPSNAQDSGNLLGKVLRLNPDGSVPSDNPFVANAAFVGKNKLIWALGLRNPFTFAVASGTGRIFINDVGSSPPQAREEINDGLGGSNYGWPLVEGVVGTAPAVAQGSYRNPLLAYDHSSGGCAIAGGAFYDPATVVYTGYQGSYFFADLCGGWVRIFDPASGATADALGGLNQPVDLQLGPDGRIHVLSHGDGAVLRLDFHP